MTVLRARLSGRVTRPVEAFEHPACEPADRLFAGDVGLDVEVRQIAVGQHPAE
jgi:hypothetical protein